MKFMNTRLFSTILGCCTLLLSVSPPAAADDSEVFTSAAFAGGTDVRPNVLFIIDTSGSMDTDVPSYDGTKTYTGDCTDSTLVYWSTKDSSTPPKCGSGNYITTTANRCHASYLGMLDDGWWRGRSQQLLSQSKGWTDLASDQHTRAVECGADNGIHGDDLASSDPSSANKYARDGGETGRTNRWGDGKASNPVLWDGVKGVGAKQSISFYSPNYINWFYNGGPSKNKSRLEIVRGVAETLIDKLQNVNLGIMRYSNNEGGTYETTAQGGMVTVPVQELTVTSRKAMKDELDKYKPAGNTPLSETFYEAYLYFAGGAVDYGSYSKTDKDHDYWSVPESRKPVGKSSANYDSPMDFSCQGNYIVYLTDGLPTADDDASKKIGDLLTAAGDDPCPATGPDGSVNGRCMVQLAGYMNKHDMKLGIGGTQNVKTYVIGFGDDIETSEKFLSDVATAGGGKSYTNKDQAGLTAALEEIFKDVAVGENGTFVSPTVAVNAFNRTRNLDSLFISVFAPSNRLHWPGNLKKYKLVNGIINGSNGPAVDSGTGFFSTDAKDFFSADTLADGPDVKVGGAASRIPTWAVDGRKVFTYLGTAQKNLSDASNAVAVANSALTVDKIGLLATATAAQRQQLIEFIRGRDVRNDDLDNPVDTKDDRHAMGDPMRVRPAVAIYGGTEAAPEGVVFTTTNDGVLHAIDMDTGAERWSFIPEEFLTRQQELYVDAVTPGRKYALDSDVRIFKYDVNGNGIIDAGKDKMYAVFGFGRGGSTYYALDVTSKDGPVFLWKKNQTDLPQLGQSWSAPIITRVNVNTTKQTDAQKFVVIFAGGYDESQETYKYTKDSRGNAIYMLEMETGNQLWMASKTGISGANWTSDDMDNSIPSDVAVLDIDGDSYADRMYVGDMGGRIWRFDIWHGQAPDKLVTGGLFATLGAGELTGTPALADGRRFYYAPDLAVVTPRGSRPYMNLAIGSGYRGHPLEADTQDRFYSLRDYAPFTRLLNTAYTKPIVDGDLVNVTTDVNKAVPDGSAGWRLLLNFDGWVGEKVLAESVTAGGVIFFPTFTPQGADDKNPCLPKMTNRTYAVYLDSAKPFGLRDGAKPGDPPETDSPDDRFIELKQGGIAPGMALVKTPEGKTLCLEGVESLGRCVDIGDVVRTYWEHR